MTHPEHGEVYVNTPLQVQYNQRYGWKVATPPPVAKPRVKKVDLIRDDTLELKDQYEKLFGKRPHWNMNRHNIKKAIDKANGDS